MSSSLLTHYPWQPEFDDISSFSDEQVAPLLSELRNDKAVTNVLEQLFHSTKQGLADNWQASLDGIQSISEFQDWIEEFIFPLIKSTYCQLTASGLDDLNPQNAYIFISNHRDIIMDPLLLNLLLKENKFSTAHCAIGDNLLTSSSANKLARLNHCFKVVRSLKSPKAILRAMKIQSAYIGHRHFIDGDNIWIAQKEGRSKDNLDKTNPALIKMLCLSRPKDVDLRTFINQLNIVPVCYSYEWDPCDIDKAYQLETTDYQKTDLDDLIAVQKGLMGQKGNIHITFGKPIKLAAEGTFTDVASSIDSFISNHYQLFPVNFAAHRKLTPKQSPENTPSKQDINHASKLLESRINAEPGAIQKRIIQAYAAPLSSRG